MIVYAVKLKNVAWFQIHTALLAQEIGTQNLRIQSLTTRTYSECFLIYNSPALFEN